MIEMKHDNPAIRRRREIEFLSRELIQQARDLMTAIVGLTPADLAAFPVDLTEGTPMRCVADRLDETRLCFELLREEIGSPARALAQTQGAGRPTRAEHADQS